MANAWGVVFARRREVVAVAGLIWVLWRVFVGAGFSCFSATTFSNSHIQSSQRRLGEGAPTASQSAYRELAPTYPPQGVPFIVLPPEKDGVIS